jgi:hypothetical protein
MQRVHSLNHYRFVCACVRAFVLFPPVLQAASELGLYFHVPPSDGLDALRALQVCVHCDCVLCWDLPGAEMLSGNGLAREINRCSPRAPSS